MLQASPCCPAFHEGLVIIQGSGSLLPWIWKELGGGTGFFACCWEYLPAACHENSFPCWASCHVLSVNCHLRCVLAVVHQVSMCSCSREGLCNKSHSHPPSDGTYPIPILAVLISRLRGEAGDHFVFLTDTWLMTCGCSCLGNAAQVWSKFSKGEKKV